MKFVCFVYENADEMAARTDAYEDAISHEHVAYDRKLKDGGHFVFANALAQPSSAKVVRKRNDRITATDGPFVETKEHIGGFIVIEAPNMEKAVQLAGEIPSARFSFIEVRPVRHLDAEMAARRK